MLIWIKTENISTFLVDKKSALTGVMFNPCPVEYIKMPHPFLIFSQSDYLIETVDINSHT